MSVDDKYTYPGSGGVLVNAAGYRTHEQLDEAMNDVASITMAEVRSEPVPDRPGYDYLQSIHERMFGDLVPGIAGRLRDVDVQATGTGIPYCRPEYIDANLSTLFGKLEREDYLAGLDADTFADRLADRWGELSAIHPYRDGNTRSQSTYVGAIAERAGHPIDWERVDVDELRTARLHAVAGNDRPLADYLRTHLVSAHVDAARDGRELGAFEREDLEVMRDAGVDLDAASRAPSIDPSTRLEQWPSLPEQSRGSDLER
ncbi:Fic/DOC family protein [Curtobacterium flaccumfaciens]|uniref:Fic/DOC family protein n=1 Tax=Curtobacterium flaccumfaciens TaxID=2035 RepID=UPI001BDE2CEE|nr:Fic family protein [Curtobacterium flaccumfaciens]MBT1633259.1 Fic family protein [Curtobacterium flaccumfaciens pv. oortii]MCX2846906.1 Fic family protein [Curtobacterium flaccumfaciens pv. oortii]